VKTLLEEEKDEELRMYHLSTNQQDQWKYCFVNYSFVYFPMIISVACLVWELQIRKRDSYADQKTLAVAITRFLYQATVYVANDFPLVLTLFPSFIADIVQVALESWETATKLSTIVELQLRKEYLEESRGVVVKWNEGLAKDVLSLSQEKKKEFAQLQLSAERMFREKNSVRKLHADIIETTKGLQEQQKQPLGLTQVELKAKQVPPQTEKPEQYTTVERNAHQSAVTIYKLLFLGLMTGQISPKRISSLDSATLIQQKIDNCLTFLQNWQRPLDGTNTVGCGCLPWSIFTSNNSAAPPHSTDTRNQQAHSSKNPTATSNARPQLPGWDETLLDDEWTVFYQR
jgi:hypothetical protein